MTIKKCGRTRRTYSKRVRTKQTMTTGSANSLRPLDIADVVSRALRLSSSDGTEVQRPRPTSERGRLNSLTANDDGKRLKATASECNSHCNTFCEGNHLAEMEIEAWAEARSGTEDLLETETNIEQLDEFCRYIDDSDEEFQPQSVESSSSDEEQRCRSHSGYQQRNRAKQPPAKKRRNTISVAYYEGSSPEVSPVKYALDPLLNPTQPWKVKLYNSVLWKQFDSIGTEMVITKNGRRMFPSLVVSIAGMKPDAIYSLTLEILPVDSRRYKFVDTEWMPMGRVEKKQHHGEYNHPESPNSGSYWMENPVAFKLVKLTNNKNTKHVDQIILNSMQRYEPCLRITCQREGVTQSYTFPETKFIAVTAYQNNRITQLKIDNNPYARAFRDSISSPDGFGLKKKGGHCAQRKLSSPAPRSRNARRKSVESASSLSSCQPSPVSSPQRQPDPPISITQSSNNCCNSATSTESGFESGDCIDYVFMMNTTVFPQILPEDNPYGCPINYWADDNSLYNPALIAPPPLLDSTSSISEPYLKQSSQMAIEFAETVVSPVKGLYGEPVDLDITYIDVENVDDDDVFL